MTKNQIKLDDLFGKDRAQEDENLEKYFIKTAQYDTIFSGKKELVIGRKGAGKSALFSMLNKELVRDGKIVISISPKGDDYVYINQQIDQYSEIVLDEDFKYSLVWKDFILSELALAILKNDKTPELKKYLKSKEKLGDSFALKFIKSIFKVLGSTNLKAKAGEIEVGFDINFSELFDLATSPELDKVKREILSVINRKAFYVLFDNLDEPWKNENAMNSWLRGLILSMRQLKRDFNKLRLICFLRSDIFDEISRGSDLFDSRSEIIKISWNDNRNYSLRRLIATRIAVYFNKPKPATFKDFDSLWSMLYPQKIFFHSNKYIWATKYIIDRTFSRPREFLQFCRLALEKSTSNALPIPYDSILHASKEFSNWKLLDLVGEYSKSYKNIDKTILACVGIFDKNWTVSYQKLIDHFSNLDESVKIFSLSNDEFLKPENIVSLLYKCGFLRQVVRKRRRSFLTYEDEPFFNTKTVIFDVHPAFRNKLILHSKISI